MSSSKATIGFESISQKKNELKNNFEQPKKKKKNSLTFHVKKMMFGFSS
jgi:hypothetical protein